MPNINGQLAQADVYILPLEVLGSRAGFYIGTFSPYLGHISRESVEYWSTQAKAQEALDTSTWTQRTNP